jgi:hypothetical protein
LIAELRDGDPAARRSAARALAAEQHNADEAAAALAAALQDSDLEVRELAADSLGRIGPAAKSALPALQQSLQDSESSVRRMAALAIHQLNPSDERYRRVLIEALRAGDGPVFLELGRRGAAAEWAVPALVELLSDPRVQVRTLAARALGEIGFAGNDVEAALRRRLRDAEPVVRKEAENALQQITSQSASTVTSSR